MKSGKSRLQRVKVLASGKYKFVKNLVSRKSNPKTKTKKSSSRKGGNMGKKKKRRSGKSIQQTAFKWIRVGALAGPGVAAAANAMRQGWGIDGAVDQVLQRYTGFSVLGSYQGFDAQMFLQGWTPYLASVLATYGIPKISSILRRL